MMILGRRDRLITPEVGIALKPLGGVHPHQVIIPDHLLHDLTGASGQSANNPTSAGRGATATMIYLRPPLALIISLTSSAAQPHHPAPDSSSSPTRDAPVGRRAPATVIFLLRSHPRGIPVPDPRPPALSRVPLQSMAKGGRDRSSPHHPSVSSSS
ncbi:hypothetical protein IOD13_19265 [Brevibacterium casei]|nr:hypothetical protein [Brevibacterium casei]